MKYKNSLKKKLCEMICINGKSTIKTANEYGVPLKTLEKWITAYNKNPHYFDEEIIYNDFHIVSDLPIKENDDIDYSDLSNDELKDLLMKRDIEIARLKKNYQVETNGMGKKVFITFCKKNIK
jgi:plastocyanin domain-containing protein